MTAWCARCCDAQEVDDRGCTVCAELNAKYREAHAAYTRKHRARLRTRGVCINGANHGPPEPGKTKCTACLVVHRKSNKRKPYLSRTDGL